MPKASRKTKVQSVPTGQHSDKVAQNYRYEEFVNSELVISLVGAVGTELNKVVEIVKERLQVYKYTVHEIRISSDIIPKVANVKLRKNCDEYRRIDTLMTAGDDARQNSGDNSILSLGAAAWINGKKRQSGQDFMPRNAYIISSLKHPEEVLQLRRIYPLGFYLLGVYTEEARRHDYLVNDKRISSVNAKLLMERDKDENTTYGQRVADTFHMSDFFVRIDDSRDQLKKNLWRILDILFGHPNKTPTFDEYAMFLAHVAALRSADLSRQVGAVIAKNKEIIATGANDCPKYGGGLYWPYLDATDGEIKDEPKGRDYMRGEDANKAQLQHIIQEIIDKAKHSKINPKTLEKVLNLSPIKDLTEYGRAVHSEMEALMQCARSRGNARGATLYTTTFSCHNCAKHMIAAGIKRVVYIEPYPKSKATELHDDAISFEFYDVAKEKHCKMNFEPFVGIGPRRFFDLFSMRLGSGNQLIRKNSEGKPLKWKPENGNLRLQMLPSCYLDLELDACNRFLKVSKMQGGQK